MSLRVETVESASGFEALEPEWNSLLERSPSATIFSTFEWAWTCFTYRSPVLRPLVLRVLDGGTLVALVPLHLCVRRFFPRVLQPIAMGYAWLADYLDLLAAEGQEQAAVESLVGYLRREKSGWDILDWPELRNGSITREALPQAAAAAGLGSLADEGTPCHEISLPTTWSEYLSRLSPTMRETLERKTRKVFREQGARVERVGDLAGISSALEALHRFQQARWGAQGSASLDAYVGFLRCLAPRLARRGWLDLRVLGAASAPLAVICNFRFRRTAAYYAMAFDPDERWNRYSVGTILLGDAIRQAIEDGSSTFDMMRGDEGFKARFGTTVTRNRRVRVFRTRSVHAAYALARRLRGRGLTAIPSSE